MSGNCEKCGEHATECRCHSRSMKISKKAYDIDTLIQVLEEIKKNGDGHLNVLKAFYSLAIKSKEQDERINQMSEFLENLKEDPKKSLAKRWRHNMKELLGLLDEVEDDDWNDSALELQIKYLSKHELNWDEMNEFKRELQDHLKKNSDEKVKE